MIALGGFAAAGFAFLLARGLVFYHAFFSMSRAAYAIAGIEAIRGGPLTRLREALVILASAPLVGFAVLSPTNAREMMQQAMENTAARFSSRDNARAFLRIAHDLSTESCPRPIRGTDAPATGRSGGGWSGLRRRPGGGRLALARAVSSRVGSRP